MMTRALPKKFVQVLPAPLAGEIQRFVRKSRADFSCAITMTGECEDVSRDLAKHLNGKTLENEFGEQERVQAFRVQKWMHTVPSRLRHNHMAEGHYVVIIKWNGQVWEVDMTAAQFPEMGWTGPRIKVEMKLQRVLRLLAERKTKAAP